MRSSDAREVCHDRALADFQTSLTRALNDAGVPAMPSWQEAIDYLAQRPRGAVDALITCADRLTHGPLPGNEDWYEKARPFLPTTTGGR